MYGPKFDVVSSPEISARASCTRIQAIRIGWIDRGSGSADAKNPERGGWNKGSNFNR
jgi:hypothetical protein